MISPPHGIAEIRKVYGDIAVANGQVVAPPHWESNNMIVVRDLPRVAKLYIHKLIEEPLRAALEGCVITSPAYEIRTIGCFNPRPKRVSGELSVHSWGAAVDINAATNPLAPARGAPIVKDIPDAWIAVFEQIGFRWGGRFPRPDPMHFQFCSGY